MNRDDIIRMAREAGWRVDSEGEVLEGDGWHIQTDIVERFAELVAAAEREDGIPDMPIKVQDDSESPPESWAQSAQVNGMDRWIKANTEHRQWYICPKCSYQAPRFKDEWQGLMAEDLAEIPPSCYEGAIWADARLKEKNT